MVPVGEQQANREPAEDHSRALMASVRRKRLILN